MFDETKGSDPPQIYLDIDPVLAELSPQITELASSAVQETAGQIKVTVTLEVVAPPSKLQKMAGWSANVLIAPIFTGVVAGTIAGVIVTSMA